MRERLEYIFDEVELRSTGEKMYEESPKALVDNTSEVWDYTNGRKRELN